jgi:hypothetical protein
MMIGDRLPDYTTAAGFSQACKHRMNRAIRDGDAVTIPSFIKDQVWVEIIRSTHKTLYILYHYGDEYCNLVDPKRPALKR